MMAKQPQATMQLVDRWKSGNYEVCLYRFDMHGVVVTPKDGKFDCELVKFHDKFDSRVWDCTGLQRNGITEEEVAELLKDMRT